MKFLIKIIFLILCSLISAINGNAQQSLRFSPDSIAYRQAFILRQKLSLSTKQQRDVETATKRLHTMLLSTHQPKDSSKMHDKLVQHLYKNYLNDLRKILTPEQFQNYEAMIQQQSGSFSEHARQKGIKMKELNLN